MVHSLILCTFAEVGGGFKPLQPPCLTVPDVVEKGLLNEFYLLNDKVQNGSHSDMQHPPNKKLTLTMTHCIVAQTFLVTKGLDTSRTLRD